MEGFSCLCKLQRKTILFFSSGSGFGGSNFRNSGSETRGPETPDPGIHPRLVTQDVEAVLSKEDVDFFFHVPDNFIIET